MEELETDVIDYKDKYIRTLADFENFKKRKNIDITNAVNKAKSDIILKLIPFIDDIEAGIKIDPKLSPMYSKYTGILKGIGIHKFGEVGDRFDDSMHNAVMMSHNPNVNSGLITEIVKSGYLYEGNIIRYADVVVND